MSTKRLLVSITAAFFLFCYRVFHAIHTGSKALFEGFWLGLLPDSAIDTITQRSYRGGRQYTRPAYLDSGFQFWEEIAIGRYFRPGSKVLVAAAGGGREIIALTRAGWTADGFECCSPMVVEGNRALSKRGIDSRIVWAPPSQIAEISEVYDAAVIGWNGYTYIVPRARRIAFMRSLIPNLGPRSPVLVSFAIRPRDSASTEWPPRIANVLRVLTFRSAVFTTGATFPGRPRHEFTRDQFEAEIQEAGYSLAEFWKWGVFGAAICFTPGQSGAAD